MGSRQPDKGTGSSREGLDTDSGGGCRLEELDVPPLPNLHLMLYLMLKGPERIEDSQRERR